ncbi:histone deacetylase, putative [Hepatocystis sp. ex Piliocolobus tephrosceles]|nr:histone deacetylase, putative [Hepatocystis sp. ex Piliocolobus tephrosceles]
MFHYNILYVVVLPLLLFFPLAHTKHNIKITMKNKSYYKIYMFQKKTHICFNRIIYKKVNKCKLKEKTIDFFIEHFLHPLDKNNNKKKEKNEFLSHGVTHYDTILYETNCNESKNTDMNNQDCSDDTNYWNEIKNIIKKKVERTLNKKTCNNNNNIFEKQETFVECSKNPPYVFHPTYSDVDIKKDHRFKIKKYEHIFNLLTHDKNNVYNNNFFVPTYDVSKIKNYLFTVHEKSFINKMLNIIKNNENIEMFELDLCSDLISRFLVEINGTVLSSLLSLKYWMCLHIGGGNHHSKKDRGDGFCIFNDIAIAIHYLLFYKIVEQVIILDCDVHQGDGTAELFENYKNVKTISLHCKDNYPYKKKKSYIDIELDAYIKDDVYLSIYEHTLNCIEFEKKKKTIIFYLAGADISKDDDIGLLLISDEGIYKRDFMTYKKALEHCVPIVTLLAGGYNKCDKIVATKHLLTFNAAKDAWNIRNKFAKGTCNMYNKGTK